MQHKRIYRLAPEVVLAANDETAPYPSLHAPSNVRPATSAMLATR